MKGRWKEWLALILGIMLAVRTGGNVWRLYQAGGRLKEAREELAEAKTKNEQLKKRLAEVSSSEFVEKEAREKLGYGKEGEVMLILPDQPSSDSQISDNKSEKPNWRKWWDLYVRL